MEILASGAGLNIIRPARRALPSVRPGINRYIRLCSLINRPAMPPKAEAAQLRRATFNTGKTFNQYQSHLQKATILLNQRLDWLTPTIRGISKGRRNAHDVSCKFPNFIRSADLLQILEWAKLDNSQGREYFISHLFSLRVPSETLALARSPP